MEANVGGLYYISDRYFMRFTDPCLSYNKGESRPFYYCFREQNGLLWMIPLTSSRKKVELAKKKMLEGKTDIFHPTCVGGIEGVMLIANIFPVSDRYIKSSYTIEAEPVMFKDKKEMREIERKATKVLILLRKGVKFAPHQPDIFSIEAELLKDAKAA